MIGAGEAVLALSNDPVIPGIATPPNGDLGCDDIFDASDPFVRLPPVAGFCGCKSSNV